MAIESGQQVLPTEGFQDFADETKAEEDEYEDQINDDQPLNDEDTVSLEDVNEDEDEDEDDTADEEAKPVSEKVEETEEAEPETDEANEGDENKVDETKSESESEPKPDEEAPETPKEVSKREKFERYSRSVQRRINKEVKQREQLKTENDALKQRLDGIEAKMSKESDDSEASVLANRIRNATSIKQQLMEDAEYDQVAQVDNDLMQMRIQQAKLEERTQQQQYQDQGQGQGQGQDQGQDQGNQQQVDVPNVQKEWITKNERFGKDQAYTGYVNSTYDQMLEEGYDPEDSNMYTELDRRTGRTPTQAPAQVLAQSKDQVKAPVVKPRPKAAPTPNVVQSQRKAKSKGITEADKANMRNWGLDPGDKEVRKEWLANKRKKA